MAQMTDKQLNELLKQAKGSALFGGDFDIEKQEELRQRLWQELGFEEEAAVTRYSWTDYVDYAFHGLAGSVLRPVVMSVAALVLIIGGFGATVNAGNSIPGDILYPVKLAGEKIQIAFAPSSQKKAQLHTEFASRRLHEAAEVAKEPGENDEEVMEAVVRFKTQLASANQELAAIKESQPEQVAQVAAAIEQTTNEYEALLADTKLGESESEGVVEEVASAIEAVAETESAAIEALVETNETTPEPESKRNIERAFQKQLTNVNVRVATNLSRLDVIAGVLNSAEVDSEKLADFTAKISKARGAVSLNDNDINEAIDIFAAGGHRRSFEILDEVSARLTTSEEIITGLEIEISTGLLNPVKSTSEETSDEDNEINSNLEDVSTTKDTSVDDIIEVAEF